MKIKYIAIYAALGVAFLAVSLWVILSRGKNAKAIRAKYRLGGLMLTVAGMISVASCDTFGGGGMSCYDPVMPEYVTYTLPAKSLKIHSGDEIEVKILDTPYESHTYKIATGDGLLQEGPLGKANATYKIKIVDTDYKGEVYLWINGISDDKEYMISELHLEIE